MLAAASGICHKVAQIADCAFNVFCCYGMKLNFSAGRSEATIGLYGPGSKQARKQLLLRGDVLQVDAGDFHGR